MTFLWPDLIPVLGLVPILIALYLLAQRRRRAYAVRFTNLALLSQVVTRGPGARRHVPPLLFLLGLATLLVGLARPTAVFAVPRNQATVVLVMDVSGSMAAADLRPNRMTAATQAARAFVDALPDDTQVGLVSFSLSASLLAPPTRDHAVVTRAIGSLRASGGTAIGDGLDLAIDQIVRLPADAGGARPPAQVVLLSDGQSTSGRDPAEAAARAAQKGIKVHSVGIGERGARPLAAGVQAILDEATLQRIAAETGGAYYYAAETRQLEQIYTDLGSQITWVEERTEVTPFVTALGALLLTVGGLLSLRWFQQFP